MVNNAWNGQQQLREEEDPIYIYSTGKGQHQGHYLEEEVHSIVRSARKMI